ncbi:MAG: hypothetical protein ABSF64_38845 [Bryobacteraceae bacterium]
MFVKAEFPDQHFLHRLRVVVSSVQLVEIGARRPAVDSLQTKARALGWLVTSVLGGLGVLVDADDQGSPHLGVRHGNRCGDYGK